MYQFFFRNIPYIINKIVLFISYLASNFKPKKKKIIIKNKKPLRKKKKKKLENHKKEEVKLMTMMMREKYNFKKTQK